MVGAILILESERLNTNVKIKIVLIVALMMYVLSGCASTHESREGVKPTGTITPIATIVTQVTSEAPAITIEPNRELKAHFIDVGQADCILLQLPNNKNMLVDAGNNNDDESILGYLKANNIKKLDWVIGTHPHEDHIGSMDSVISALDIENIVMPKITHNTKTFEDVLLAVKSKGLKVKSPEAGSYLLNEGALSVQVLAPNSSNYEELNNYSIVLKVKYLNNSFLLTGDAESISEQEIMAKGYDVKADVLKVGHHGSNSSTTNEFLKKVNPKYAVISVGKGNSYGHPHADTISKLKGVEILRTDELGTIVITSDGNSIRVDKKASPIKENAPPEVKENPVGMSNTKFIGNKNSKIFHNPTCSSLPSLNNQVQFKLTDEAINKGYRACKKCNP